MKLRMFVAFLLSLTVTVALFGFVRSVTTGPAVPGPGPKGVEIHLTALIPPEPEVVRPLPAKPTATPVRPPQPGISSLPVLPAPAPDPAHPEIGPELPPDQAEDPFTPTRLPIPGGPGGPSNRSATPLVRIEPQYPPQASERGIEGWVVVGFTISEDGTVKDAAVVQSSHPVFEREAVRAVLGWKYQPQVTAGKPEELRQQVMLRFSLGG